MTAAEFLALAHPRGVDLDTAREMRVDMRLRAEAATTPLQRWLWRAAFLARERATREILAQRDAHFFKLTVAAVREAEQDDVECLIAVLRGGLGDALPWSATPHNRRPGTHWAAIHAEAQNHIVRCDLRARRFSPIFNPNARGAA